MSIEFDIYTGTLKYKEIEFSFVPLNNIGFNLYN